MKDLDEDILRRYLENKCCEEDYDQINAWMDESEENASKLFRMEEIFFLGKRNGIDEQKRAAYAEKHLYRKIEVEKTKELRITRKHTWMKYAAIFAILMLLGGAFSYVYFHTNLNTEMMIVTAPEGSIKKIVLPDGSKVWLNHQAMLKYPRQFSPRERNVFLEGEAYFEVSKNREKPFIVESEAMRIRVLGTVFNFKSYKNRHVAEATLIEGEIEVKGNNEEGMIILAPGQKAELDRTSRRLKVKQVEAKLDAVWHDNLIPFEKANIFAIAKVLERFYDVKIILSPDIQSDKTYSGVLKKKDTIESVLNSLKNSIPINYKIVGNNIFISSDTK